MCYNIRKQNQIYHDFALLEGFRVCVNHCGTHVTQDGYGLIGR